MSRFRPISTDEVVSLAESLDLRLAEDEAKGAVDRIHTLSDIYVALEEASAGSLKRRHEEYDRLEMSANGSSPTNNTYNQWLTRFGLSRPSMDGVLDGVDVAVKDNMCVRGVEMTCGSHAFEGFVPGDHAEVVHRLLDAGATIVGKTNMDELAFGPTSETSAFGPTANPVAPDHVSGGSSSGSAAAVAAGQVDLALGSDTGGSVRIPAS
jgi:amidase/aspartyl-tRNA(Asn)/glutamyl-tRNA(Gln) amidotransferase subunit A